MNTNKREQNVVLKRTKPRYIMVRENIHEALDLYTMSLYMAFRYESDFSQEDAVVKRSAKFLYEKAKISRRQFFRCLNILEDFGLILRDSENQLNSVSSYHVAQELNYFNTDCVVVPDMHGVVPDRHTDQYSFPISSNINITTTVSDETNSSSKKISNQEIVDAYHAHLPELTRIKVIDRDLNNKINSVKKNWHKYQKEGKAFTLELFIDFLRFIKVHHSWFLKPRVTESGNVRKNSLRNLIAEINLARFANGEFSAT